MTTSDRITRLLLSMEYDEERMAKLKAIVESLSISITVNQRELKTIRDGEPVKECQPCKRPMTAKEHEEWTRMEAERTKRGKYSLGLGPAIEPPQKVQKTEALETVEFTAVKHDSGHFVINEDTIRVGWKHIHHSRIDARNVDELVSALSRETKLGPWYVINRMRNLIGIEQSEVSPSIAIPFVLSKSEIQ